MRTLLPVLLAASALVACREFRSETSSLAEAGAEPKAVLDDDDGDDDGGDDESEVLVAADQIPAVVKDAARAALPGLVIEVAELETGAEGSVYCVHGRVAGAFKEVEVTPDGKVVSIEDDGDDDEDDD